MFSISKLLFTAAIVGLVVLLLRARSRSGQVSAAAVEPLHLGHKGRIRFIRGAAYVVIVIMIAGSLLFAYRHWQDGVTVVQVRVINSYTGQSQVYQALKGDVEARHFLTLDGRRVSLAEVERLELSGGD